MISHTRDFQCTAKGLKAAVAIAFLCLAACARHTPSERPVVPEAGVARLISFDAPACGARIFVAMGANQKYPSDENMRIPAGDLFLNGDFVDAVSKYPESTVLDVPAGQTELSWVPSGYDKVARNNTKQNRLTVTLADRETAFVVLDWYDDTPQAVGFFATAPANAFRTEVAQTRQDAFAGKRVVFHRRLDKPCSPGMTVAAAPPPPPIAPQSPPQQAVIPSLPPIAPQSPPPPPVVMPQPVPQPAMPQIAKPQQATPPPASPQPVTAPPKPVQATPPAREQQQAALPPEPQQAIVAPPKPVVTAPSTPEPPQSVVLQKPAQTGPPLEPQQAAIPLTQPASDGLSIPPSPQADVPLPNSRQGDVDVLQAFVPAVQYYYVVNARNGAPAFPAPHAEGSPLYTFKDSTELNVITVDADKQWLKVKLPDGRSGFVSTSVVTTGARLQ